MTVIAAHYTEDSYAIGYDTVGWVGGFAVEGPSKLHKRGAAVVGLAGSGAFGRAVDSMRKLEEEPAVWQVQEWCEDLSDHVAEWAREHGHGKQDDEGTWAINAWMLVATAHGLWNVSPVGCATRIGEDYFAIGAGAQLAMGAMGGILRWSAPDFEPTSRMLVTKALETAIAHGDGVGGNCVVVTSDD